MKIRGIHLIFLLMGAFALGHLSASIPSPLADHESIGARSESTLPPGVVLAADNEHEQQHAPLNASTQASTGEQTKPRATTTTANTAVSVAHERRRSSMKVSRFMEPLKDLQFMLGNASGPLLAGRRDFSAHFGSWPMSCDQCREDCLATATRGPTDLSNHVVADESSEPSLEEMEKTGSARLPTEKKQEFTSRHEEVDKLAWTTPVSHWGPMALQNLMDENLELWQTNGITLHHQVYMASCSYGTKTHINPSGFWVHIHGHNITRLRLMKERYGRYKRQFQLLKRVILKNPPLEKNMVAYFSVTDTPCDPTLPYMTAFSRRGVKGIVIPDDTFENKPNWNSTHDTLTRAASETPFQDRKNEVLFGGSPTHQAREAFKASIEHCCPEFAHVVLAVMDQNKHMMIPLEEHAKSKFLASIRGRTASNRDKYLNLAGSAILRVEETEPWFQFYHALWKPWLNYIPVHPAKMNCTFEALRNGSFDHVAEKIAQRSQEIGAFLTDQVVHGYLWKVLVRFSQLQRYEVPDDPVEFLRMMSTFAKKHHPKSGLNPDIRVEAHWHIFHKWTRRRSKQIYQCQIEAEVGQTYDEQGNVLIHGVPAKKPIVAEPHPASRCVYM